MTAPSIQKVFGAKRNYRILLPPSYESSGKRYPVILLLARSRPVHGRAIRQWNRHNSEDGELVAAHGVVAMDGYAPERTQASTVSPWDILQDGSAYDFGVAFQELMQHIRAFRTLTDRRHRAISGLQHSRFMSRYLSARYLISSAVRHPSIRDRSFMSATKVRDPGLEEII